MVPPLQNCSFCENCFSHNLKTNEVKYIKVYNFRKEISQGIYLKSDFLAKKFFNKGKKKKKLWTKITTNLLKSSKYVRLGIFSHFFFLFLIFENFGIFGQNN